MDAQRSELPGEGVGHLLTGHRAGQIGGLARDRSSGCGGRALAQSRGEPACLDGVERCILERQQVLAGTQLCVFLFHCRTVFHVHRLVERDRLRPQISGKCSQARRGALGERGKGIPRLTCVWGRRPDDRFTSGGRRGLQIATCLDKGGEIAQIVSEGFVEQ
ncbi:hypothetical protein D9M72_531710 [compost metagenome]